MQIDVSEELQRKIDNVNRLRSVVTELAGYLRQLEMAAATHHVWLAADHRLEAARTEYQALYREVCRELAVAAGVVVPRLQYWNRVIQRTP